MKKYLLLISTLLLIACTDNKSEREEFWNTKLNNTFEVGMTIEEAKIAARENGFELMDDQKGDTLISSLETIEGDGIVCSKWHLFGEVKHANGKVASYKVTTAGVCL